MNISQDETAKTTEATILDLLARKHAKDLFVPHCKTGPTWTAQTGTLFVLDAWAMRKSWTSMVTTGYEVKVDRQDFLNDNKWRNYLAYCNDFYFVSPSGVVLPTELPEQAGLYYVSKTGTKLFLKKKCVRREVDIPQELLYYIVMWRAKIVRDPDTFSKKAYWESWLRGKKRNVDFGALVGKEIQRAIKDKIDRVEAENVRLQAENDKLVEVRNLLNRWDLDVNTLSRWGIGSRLEQKVRSIESGIPEGLMVYLNGVISNLEAIRKIFEKEEGNDNTK